MAAAAKTDDSAPHVPVLLAPLLAAVAPVSGHWVDGTLGAGGYARGLLEAGAERVTGIDRDPVALRMAEEWGADYGERFRAVEGNFAELDVLARYGIVFFQNKFFRQRAGILLGDIKISGARSAHELDLLRCWLSH
jgi:16S rRNA C1402 N4-methylase RsmH